MKYVKFGLYCLCVVMVIKYTIFMATDYVTQSGRLSLPIFLWIIDTINLFIHEAGHAVFYLFGRFLYFLGGSLLQIGIPIVTVIVFMKTSIHSLLFTLYWTGHSLINVSVYIADAPYRSLRLISPSAIHDWHWIFTTIDCIHVAEDVGFAVFLLGLSVCCGGIGVGLYCVWGDCKQYFLEASA
ncbi:MAG: hypothetical protein N3A63_10090 [Bacteroidetes bacterium]|nr:hypothetical protein [Bacteroidota bacterium]